MISDSAREDYNTLPLYFSGTLYVPLKDGVIALTGMATRCGKSISRPMGLPLFQLMPVDEQGNVYVKKVESLPMGNTLEYLCVISPGGSISTVQWPYAPTCTYTDRSSFPRSAINGIIYTFNSTGTWTRNIELDYEAERFNPDRLRPWTPGPAPSSGTSLCPPPINT